MSEQTLSPSEQPPGFPSSGVRTLITLLLFFHFFAVLAGIAGNFGARSGLRRELRSVLQPYLQTLSMDTGYDYSLIYNTTDDWDHTCQIVLNPPANFTGEGNEFDNVEIIELMPDNAWPGMRRRRYLSLASSLAMLEGEDNEEANLVAALAGGMLRKASIDKGAHRFRCRAQETQPLVGLEEIEPEMRDPNNPRWFFTLYDADLVLDRERWSPSKRGGRGEMTQSRTSRGRNR